MNNGNDYAKTLVIYFGFGIYYRQTYSRKLPLQYFSCELLEIPLQRDNKITTSVLLKLHKITTHDTLKVLNYFSVS